MSFKTKARIAAQRLATYFLVPSIGQLRKSLDRQICPPDDHPLRKCGRRYFSQNDEDGILLEILRRLDLEGRRTFLELGVGDGTENNTIILLAKRWHGAWIGGEELAFALPERGSRLVFCKRWITKDNVSQLAGEALEKLGKSLPDADVISVDLDGNDGAIAKALFAAGASPAVFVVEYNAKFPPSIEFEMPYNGEHSWRANGDYFGVSLQTWVRVFSGTGYFLVCCNTTGANAFFVKNEFLDRFSDVPNNIEGHYRPGYYIDVPRSGHETEPRTVALLAVMD